MTEGAPAPAVSAQARAVETRSAGGGRFAAAVSARPARTSPARFARRALVPVAAVWLPAGLGALGVPGLSRWAVVGGYLGLGWLVPAIFIRASARAWARSRGIAADRAVGLAAGTLAGVVLLFVAARVLGP